MTQIVVTGMGAVTPLGGDVPSTWEALLAGRGAIAPIRNFDASGFDTRFAAEIAEIPALDTEWGAIRDAAAASDLLDRKTELLLVAAQEALGQSALLVDGRVPRPLRTAVCLGSEGGRRLLQEVAQRSVRFSEDPTVERAIPFLPVGERARARASHPARILADAVGARGPSRTVMTACTSAGGALAEALWLLRHGAADVALAGGTDTLVEAFMLSGFSLLGALSTRNDDPARASRPFDRDRDGFVLGEGAGLLVLETEEHARARGAPVLGRLLGAGLSNNAWRITDSPPDGEGPRISILAALEDAGLEPADVGYVNAHGTSTLMNDASETRGIRRALGPHADHIVVNSTKSMMGHLVAACGAVEAIVSLCSVRDGRVHPTANLQNPDPDCDLDCVPGEARDVPGLRVALSNSFGFGGSNATLVLGAP